jgi:hypothetical protein
VILGDKSHTVLEVLNLVTLLVESRGNRKEIKRNNLENTNISKADFNSKDPIT